MRTRPGARTLLLLTVGLCHLPALRAAEFHFDDGHSLVRNPHLRTLASIPRFFADPTLFSQNPADAMYRPLVLTAHTLNRLIDEGPAAHVAVNLALHAAVALVLLSVMNRLLPGAAPAALWATLLFGIHPLQSETVNYASARSESLAALFCLLGAKAFLDYQRLGSAWRLALLAGSLGLGLAAKETVAVLPALLLVCDALTAGFRRHPTWRAHLISWLVLIVYLIGYQSIRSSTGLSFPRGALAQLATQAKGLCFYLRAAITPVDLSVYPQFRESLSPGHAPAGLALALATSLCWLLWRARRRNRSLALAGWWWLLCLAPTAVAPLNMLVNDHRPYLALAGPLLGLASLWRSGWPPSSPRTWAGVVAVLLLAGLSWQRALVWRTEITLWRDAVVRGPAVTAAHHNLAYALHQAGQLDSARAHYERAVSLDPGYFRPLNNLGVLYRQAGDLERAAEVLRRAAQSDPAAAEPLNNLGLVLAAQGKLGEAIEVYRRALERDGLAAEVWLNLGLALRDAGQPGEAFHSLSRALQLDPTLRRRVAPGEGSP